MKLKERRKMWLFLAFPTFLVSAISLANESLEEIKERISGITPGLTIQKITRTPLADIFEIVTDGNQIFYSTKDGQYIFTGDLIELNNDATQNITQQRQQQLRQDVLSAIPLSSTISFMAKEQEKAELYIFTDITCGYCRNFHTQIDELTEAGISIHYLAFPRAGLNTRDGRLLEQAWCAEDPQTTLTELKADGRSSAGMLPCHSPIEEHLRLAASLGVTGTPYILTTSGRNIGGYLTTREVLNALH